jgi:membrane carboxypeptidase/penicillin-binding protein
MNEAYQRRSAPSDWPRPEMIIARNIDETTGLLAGPGCPDSGIVSEYFIPGTEPVRECDSPFALPGAVGAQPGSQGGQPGGDHTQPAQVKRDTVRPVPNPFRIP